MVVSGTYRMATVLGSNEVGGNGGSKGWDCEPGKLHLNDLFRIGASKKAGQGTNIRTKERHHRNFM